MERQEGCRSCWQALLRTLFRSSLTPWHHPALLVDIYTSPSVGRKQKSLGALFCLEPMSNYADTMSFEFHYYKGFESVMVGHDIFAHPAFLSIDQPTAV